MGFLSKIFGFSSKPEEAEQTAQSSCCCGCQEHAADSGSGARTAARSVSLEDLEGFVEFVAKSLVDYPDEVKVCSESNDNGKMIKILCRAGDRGKIIGKKGKTIMALRALVTSAAGRSRERVSVEVPDDDAAQPVEG